MNSTVIDARNSRATVIATEPASARAQSAAAQAEAARAASVVARQGAEAARAGAEGARDLSQAAAAAAAGAVVVSGASYNAASRAALAVLQTNFPAILAESGRAGVFVFRSGDFQALVQADTAQGIYIPPAGQNGSTGAWERQFHGPVNPLWFGVQKGAGHGAANSAAFQAMLATVRARFTVGYGFWFNLYAAGDEIRFEPGYYEWAETWELLDGTFNISGPGQAAAGGYAVVHKFPGGRTGVRVQRYNTIGGGTGTRPNGQGSDGTVLRGMRFIGGYGDAEGEFHGCQLRARATLIDCWFERFEGNGIHIEADVNSNSSNANCFHVERCSATGCRDGIYTVGGDVNAGLVIGGDYSGNRRWAVNDISFLGNTYIGLHTDGNGVAVGQPPSLTSHNGKVYGVIVEQEAWCSTNPPSGTSADNQGWYYCRDGGPNPAFNVPAWASGITWRAGGSFRSAGGNASTAFIGCYGELGQGLPQVNAPAYIQGGFQALERCIGSGLVIGGDSHGMVLRGGSGLKAGGSLLAQAGIGYQPGAGTTIVQSNSKDTPAPGPADIASHPTMRITTHGQSLDAGATVTFSHFNTAIEVNDTVQVTLAGGAADGAAYQVWAHSVGVWFCRISIRNISGGALAETLQLNLTVIKGQGA